MWRLFRVLFSTCSAVIFDYSGKAQIPNYLRSRFLSLPRMEFVKGLMGSDEKGAALVGKDDAIGSVQCMRGLNRDYLELGCDDSLKKKSIPCLNVLEAMKRLSLPVPPEAPLPKLELGTPQIASKPPVLVSRREADAQATCTKRCGIIGALLGSTLASTAFSSNLAADLGVNEDQRELVGQAGAAAASVVSVALCSRLCEPGSKQKTYEAPGVGYTVKGSYVRNMESMDQVETFAAYVEQQQQPKPPAK